MRVVAGIHRGRRLISPRGDMIRPTTDKVKEAVFGAIQFDIAGANVLDAFAGSGALGIEALSRGANKVDFVEKNRACLFTLKANLEMVEQDSYRVIKGDILKVASRLNRYDIVFLDPPYDDNLYLPMLEMAHEHEICQKGCKIVMECRKTFDFIAPKMYNFIKKKEYGDTTVWFLEYGDNA